MNKSQIDEILSKVKKQAAATAVVRSMLPVAGALKRTQHPDALLHYVTGLLTL